MTARLLSVAALLASLVVASPVQAEDAPVGCPDPCDVVAAIAGFAPPVAPVNSGTTVRWRGLDTSHPISDAGSQPVCFLAPLGPQLDPVSVRFDVDGGRLYATPAGQARTECGNVVPTAAGHVLPYHCRLHPWMVGAVLVTS